jgi:hypothetical protein
LYSTNVSSIDVCIAIQLQRDTLLDIIISLQKVAKKMKICCSYACGMFYWNIVKSPKICKKVSFVKSALQNKMKTQIQILQALHFFIYQSKQETDFRGRSIFWFFKKDRMLFVLLALCGSASQLLIKDFCSWLRNALLYHNIHHERGSNKNMRFIFIAGSVDIMWSLLISP